MVCVDGLYYLSASAFYYKELRHYRIDHITDIKLLENTKRRPLQEITGYENAPHLDLPKYVREHIFMFNGSRERIRQELKRNLR